MRLFCTYFPPTLTFKREIKLASSSLCSKINQCYFYHVIYIIQMITSSRALESDFTGTWPEQESVAAGSEACLDGIMSPSL